MIVINFYHPLFISCQIFYFTALGFLKRAQIKQAVTAIAKINPTMLPFPLNIQPIWYTTNDTT